jgi:hypothetical protein
MIEPILSLRDVHTHIQQHHILQGVSLEIKPARPYFGEETGRQVHHLRTIMGLARPRRDDHLSGQASRPQTL